MTAVDTDNVILLGIAAAYSILGARPAVPD
jgi:hypothetical protein